MTSFFSRTVTDSVEATSSRTAALEVLRVDRVTWRVSNLAVDERDSAQIVGYIERLERRRFEVLWLVPQVSWAYLDTFELARAAIIDREGFSGEVLAEREIVVVVTNSVQVQEVRRRRPTDPSPNDLDIHPPTR